jgi:hypothetical protein
MTALPTIADAPKMHNQPTRNRKPALIVWSIAGAIVISFATLAVADHLSHGAKVDLVQAEALSEYDIVLDDQQAASVLERDGHALVVNGTSEALLTLGEDSDVNAGRIELDLYIPVADDHHHGS